MFQAVVFDMDGVILDSEKIYRKYEYKAAEKFGLDMSKVDEFCTKIAGGRYEQNKIHFRDTFETDIPYAEFRKVISAGVEEHAKNPGYELKPGVMELLRFLKEKGIRTALATSTDKERMHRFLGSADQKKVQSGQTVEEESIFSYFDALICGDQVKRAKPEPDIYLTACEALGVKPAEAIGVEDSVNGVLSSAAAGLFTVMVVDLIRPNDKVREKADRIFTDIREIMGLFEEK